MKFADILLSLFVEYCIILTIGALFMMLVRPIIPQEESTSLVVIFLVWIIGTISILLSGAGWKQELNKIGLVLLFAMGWLFLAAGLSGFFGIISSLTIFVAYIIHRLGQEFPYSKWIQKLIIIKRNPEYIEEPIQEQSKSEPFGELFG